MPYRFDTDVTNPQKTAITADYALATGWTQASGLTKAQWLARAVDRHIRAVVRDYRLALSRQSAEVDAIADLANLEE